MSDNSANKLIARNTFFLYIRMAFVLLVTLYSSRVILKTLGEVDYGVYNVVAGFVSMFAFLNTSLNACIQRMYNYEGGIHSEEGFNRVYITSLIIQFFLAIIVVLTAESFGIWYLSNKLVIPDERLLASKVLFHASVFSMAVVIMEVPYSAAVMAKEKMGVYAMIGVVDVILKLAVVLMLPLFAADHLVVYGFLLLIVSLIDFILYFLYSKINILSLKFRFVFYKDLFLDMMKFSGWSMFGSFAQIIRNQGLNIILNLFFGPVVNAARGLSYQVKTALSSFMASIPTAARPQLVESYAIGNIERSKRIMFVISKICFVLLYFLALPVMGEMNYLLHLWLGDTIPEYTASFSHIILIVALVESLNWPVSMIIYATGNIGLYNLLTGFVGMLVLPLSYFSLRAGAPPISVYLISLLISILVQYVSLLCLKRVTSISLKEYSKTVLGPCFLIVVATFFIPIVLNSLMEESFLRLFLNFIISIPCILFLSYLIGLSKSEKTIVSGYFRDYFIRFVK